MRWARWLALGALACLGRSTVAAADSFRWPWESPPADETALQPPAPLSNGTADETEPAVQPAPLGNGTADETEPAVQPAPLGNGTLDEAASQAAPLRNDTVDFNLQRSDSLNSVLMRGSEFTRLVYNRVPKTGSTTMKELFELLAKRNNFQVHNDEEYLPDIRRLRAKIRALPARTIYVNHCQFWPDSPPDVGWINMVREPVDLAASSYYYSVDAEARHSEKAALDALEERKSSGSCGCYKLEFDACVRQRAQHNCTDFVGRDGLMVHATDFFCEHRHNEAHCRLGAGADASAQTRLEARTQLGLATANVRDKYFFVGLTEEFVRSVHVLEALLPAWFAGASEELGKMARMKELARHNPLTGTNMSGCVSDEARDFLKAHEPACSQELEFYEEVKQLFWQRHATVAHLVKDKVKHVKPHEFHLPKW